MATADLTTVGILNKDGDGVSTLTKPHCEPFASLEMLQLRTTPPLLLARPKKKTKIKGNETENYDSNTNKKSNV